MQNKRPFEALIEASLQTGSRLSIQPRPVVVGDMVHYPRNFGEAWQKRSNLRLHQVCLLIDKLLCQL